MGGVGGLADGALALVLVKGGARYSLDSLDLLDDEGGVSVSITGLLFDF